jgi:PTS system N-acetylglucosamine-specific IIB component
VTVADTEIRTKAEQFVDALGGVGNIKEIEGCITRLRGTVADASKVDVGKLQKLKIVGRPMFMGEGIQIVVGTHAELIGTEINNIMRGE